MIQAALPKKKTIGIHYIEGVIKDDHYGLIIGKILGVPRKEVHAIDLREEGNIKNRFLFKVESEALYKSICTQFSGRLIEIEKGYKIRVEDLSSNNTRICISRVPFEVSNQMLIESFGKYGIYEDLKATGNRLIWMKLKQHIPQVIDINQIKNFIFVKYLDNSYFICL